MYVINGAKSDATSGVKRERADGEGFGETGGFLMLDLKGATLPASRSPTLQ